LSLLRAKRQRSEEVASLFKKEGEKNSPFFPPLFPPPQKKNTQGFRRVIETANVIMATYADEKLGDTQVYPEKGTVSFSAGLHGWAFTLTVFSAIYAKRFGVEESKMMEKLWGDNFFDPTTKKWTKKPTGAATCKRGFVQFIYEPIKTIIESAINDNKEKLFGLCDKLGISSKIKADDRELVGKPLMKR